MGREREGRKEREREGTKQKEGRSEGKRVCSLPPPHIDKSRCLRGYADVCHHALTLVASCHCDTV